MDKKNFNIIENPKESIYQLAKKNRYIDLFAGCGGLSLGLLQAGWDGIFAIEKDPMAFLTLEKNFLLDNAPYSHFKDWPEWLPKTPHYIEDILENSYIQEKLIELRGNVTLIAGGPPCQGFSVAGCRNGDDPRNQLVFKQVHLVEMIKPVFVLVENVEGFERRFVSRPNQAKPVSTADEVMEELTGLGYSVGKITVNAADFGVPQYRKRVIVVAISKDFIDEIDVNKLMNDSLATVAIIQKEQLGIPINRPISVDEAIEDLSGEVIVPYHEFPQYDSSPYITAKSAYAKLMRKNIPDGTIPNCHRFSKHGEKVSNLYITAHKTQQPGRLSKKFLLENNCQSDKKVLMDKTQPCSTLTTHPDEFIHYKYPRNVSLREMARIQSFPDDFHFYGRYTLNGPRRKFDVPRNAQIGNAIPPLLGRAVGLAFARITETVIKGDLEPYNVIQPRCIQMTIFKDS